MIIQKKMVSLRRFELSITKNSPDGKKPPGESYYYVEHRKSIHVSGLTKTAKIASKKSKQSNVALI
jgi:hypothetical protein